MNDEFRPSAGPDPAPTALPRNTTPTWEVELLISGVAVFAMLQLPGKLDDALFALWPRFDAAWHDPLRMAYMYLKSAAVILAATFAIHLMLRAHWIALVGMHSIYPDGVRWDRLKMGPVQRAFEEGRGGDAAAAIDRADNRATTVFATGVALATLLLSVTLLVSLMFAGCLLCIAILDVDADVSTVFLACIFLAVLPFSLAVAVDRRMGVRLADGGVVRRLLLAVFRFWARFGFGRGNVVALLSSHSGERRTVLVVMAIFMPVIVGVMLGTRLLQSPERLGGYAGFPGPGAGDGRFIDAAHYDRERNIARDPAVPYIQDLVVIGPYLRLVIPYTPGADERAMRESCALRGKIETDAALTCLQRVHAVSVDGKAQPRLRLDPASDPRTDRPALLAMIDVRALAPGRHELRVARAAPDEAGAPDWRIAFWR